MGIGQDATPVKPPRGRSRPPRGLPGAVADLGQANQRPLIQKNFADQPRVDRLFTPCYELSPF